METINERLVLTKVFTEIRFSPTILFSDLKLLSSYKNLLGSILDFAEYDEKSRVITGQSSDGKKRVNAFNNRLIVDYDDPAKYEEFVSLCNNVIVKYKDIFEVENFDRIGIRYHIPAKFVSFNEAKNLFFDKFLHVLKDVKPPEDLISNCSSGQLTLFYSLNDEKLHITILPVKMQMMEMKVGPDWKQETFQNTIEGMLFDMDYFIEGKVTFSKFDDLLKKGMPVVKAKATLLLKALGV